MDIRTLNKDLWEGGCKGQFYVHQHRPESKGDIYSVLGIHYHNFQDGIRAEVQFYNRSGDRLNNEYIFLGDRLTDRRVSPEIADIILASGKANGE